MVIPDLLSHQKQNTGITKSKLTRLLGSKTNYATDPFAFRNDKSVVLPDVWPGFRGTRRMGLFANVIRCDIIVTGSIGLSPCLFKTSTERARICLTLYTVAIKDFK